MERTSAVGELTGSRIRAVQETVFWNLLGGEQHQPETCLENGNNLPEPSALPSLAWIMPSCVTHGFVMPSIELVHLSCADLGAESKTGVFAAFPPVCRDSGYGLTTKLPNNLGMAVWFDVHAWDYATVNGTSIRDSIGLFVTDGVAALLPEGEPVGLVLDDCAGPNCVIGNEAEPNACQALFEVENTYKEVNEVLRMVWFGYIGLFILLGILIRSRRGGKFVTGICSPLASAGDCLIRVIMDCLFGCDTAVDPNHAQDDDDESSVSSGKSLGSLGSARRRLQQRPRPVGVRMAQLTVHLKSTGQKLLDNVNLHLKRGTVNGLMGRSGAGKSTLVRSPMSLQHTLVAGTFLTDSCLSFCFVSAHTP